MNKPVYLDLIILKIRKLVMYEFWYDYVKPKYEEKTKFSYGYRQVYSIRKNGRHLYRHCKRY